MSIIKRLRDQKLSAKFTLFLALIFCGGIVISGVGLFLAIQEQVEHEVTEKGLLLTATLNAVRNYTDTEITPLLAPRLDSEVPFIPQTVPAYSAKAVFEQLSQDPEYEGLAYKEAVLNPTNLADRADAFERELIQNFRYDPGLEEIHGFRTVAGERHFYKARPIIVTESSCLRCHGNPEDAPASLLRTYGAEHGFGWELNEIVGVQLASVSSVEVEQMAARHFSTVMGIFIAIFAAATYFVNVLLQRTVVEPVKPMARLAQKISGNRTTVDEEARTDLFRLEKLARKADELGQLAGIFQQMAQAVYAREQSFASQLQQLRHQTDQVRQAGQVTRIAEKYRLQQLVQTARRTRSSFESLELGDLLRRISYCRTLTDAELRRLIELGSRRTLGAGVLIYREGEPGEEFFLILRGTVAVQVENLNLSRQLSVGDCFGEFALLLGIPRTATVRTLEEVTLFVVNRIGLKTLMQEQPAIAEQIAQTLSERQAEIATLLQSSGSLPEGDNFERSPLGWIRQRMREIFGT